MATMKEVADLANVSVATVSRVINKSGYVRPELEERVFSAMSELKYQPSALARSLRRQETLTVGLLVPQVDLPFFGALAFTIERSLFEHNYRALICSAEEDASKENAYIQMLIRQRVDGVIMVPTGHNTEGLRQLIDAGVPVVLVDRDLNIDGVSKVLSNNQQGGYEGMKHLISLGHRNIAIISALTHTKSVAARIAGAHVALAEANLTPFAELYSASAPDQFEFGYRAMDGLLQKSTLPSAVFALTDVAAVGVMHAVARHGLNIPRDVSVLGFDNIPLAAFMLPELTTVEQPIREMGNTASHLLLDIMQRREHRPQSLMLNTRLIVRQSTTAVPRAREARR